MRTKILNELKSSFEPYSKLWENWTNSSSCNLTQQEIYLINVHVKNNFKVTISDFIMFYNNIDALQKAIQILKTHYKEFQEWALLRFTNEVLNLSTTNDIGSFLDTPINELNIQDELKQILKNFNRGNLKQIFSTYTDNDFKKEQTFNDLVAFQTNCNQKNKLTHYNALSNK